MDPASVAGVELQPLGQLSTELSPVAEAEGWRVALEDDAQLGPLVVVALQVGATRYLLRSFPAAPVKVTEVHTPDAGDPTQQLRDLLAESPALGRHLQHWWDGTGWRDAPLPAAA